MPASSGNALDILTSQAAENIENAEELLRDLANNFSALIADDMGRCAAAMEALTAADPASDQDKQDLHAAAHNIKGLGGTFGYDLVTAVGQSLCQFLRQVKETDEAAKKVMQAHLSALELVIQQNIAGDGGELGQKLTAKLQSAADTVLENQGGSKPLDQ